MYDETINDFAIKRLRNAPILYCIFGLIMFNNEQIFTNKLDYTDFYEEPYKSEH